MKDYRELSRLMERTIHKYIQMEKKPREYGGTMLSQAEVHTLAIIGDYPDINVTRVAALKGITKGAASQMIYKLVDKKLIVKTVSPKSDTEVCLNLTSLGKIVYEAHQLYHEQSGDSFFKELQDMPKEYEEYAIKVLKLFDKKLDDKIK